MHAKAKTMLPHAKSLTNAPVTMSARSTASLVRTSRRLQSPLSSVKATCRPFALRVAHWVYHEDVSYR